MLPPEWPEQASNLLWAEHFRDSFLALGADDVVHPVELACEHFLVQEQNRAKRLILSGWRNMLLNSEMREKSGDLLLPHLERMALAMKQNNAPNPLEV